MSSEMSQFLSVLPCHPKPYVEESLCGYAWRLSQDNGFPSLLRFLEFCTLPKHEHPRSEITSMWRWFLPTWARLFAVFANLDDTELEALTLLSLTEKFGLEPNGHSLRGVYKTTAQVCPICLKSQPYLRRLWSLSPVSACLTHGVQLEERCSSCQQKLTVTLKPQRYLCCERCGSPWSEIPTRAAPTTVIASQQQRQAELLNLLSPEIRLVNLTSGLAEKFRYLVQQSGGCVQTFAHTHGLLATPLYHILHGRAVRVEYYLKYLSALEYSWMEFAILSIPPEISTPVPALTEKYSHLCICPTAGCPNSAGANPESMHVRKDWPDRQRVSILCKACGRSFMRQYDGTLHFKEVGMPKRVVRDKPPAVMEEVQHMGLSGMRDQDIDKHFQWEAGTAKAMWVKMGLLTQVRQAQAERRHAQRDAKFHEQINHVMQYLRSQREPITLRSIAVQMGFSENYLSQHRALCQQLRTEIDQHNDAAKQQRLDQQRLLLEEALATVKHDNPNPPLTLLQLAQSIGCKNDDLIRNFPVQYSEFKRLRKLRVAELRNKTNQSYIQRIDLAAYRLTQNGGQLSKIALLKEAGLNSGVLRFTQVNVAVSQWVRSAR